MSGHRVRRMVSLLAVIAVAVMIFMFSAQDGQDSSKLSGTVTRWLLTRLVPGFADMARAEQQAYLERAGFLVRKAAHFSEYALLALTLVIFLHDYAANWRPPAMVLCAWGLATLYACTDELHQMFVDSRGPAATDVCIDSAGAVLGALVGMALVLSLARRRRAVAERKAGN